jgi:hypothetical protein
MDTRVRDLPLAPPALFMGGDYADPRITTLPEETLLVRWGDA